MLMATDSPQDSGPEDPKGPKGAKRPWYATTLGALGIALGVAALVVLVLSLVLIEKQPPREAAPAPYEEYVSEAFEKRARAIDAALLEVLRAQKPELTRLKVEAVEYRRVEGQDFHFQTIALPVSPAESQKLFDALGRALADRVPGARLVDGTKGEWSVSLGAIPTHRLLLAPEKPAVAEKPRKPGSGRLALVIDDMGEDAHFAQGLAKLGVPAAFSIWPDSGNREAVLKIAKASGNVVLVHMPMQPKGYPGVNPGKHPLLTTMSADQIRETLARALGRVPGAVGVNNHMGSQFTEFPTGMKVVLSALGERGLLFLDSKTTPESAAPQEARKLGLKILQRDVFLDNEQSVAAILAQLRKAEDVARSKGQAIAIGHPHPETLQALQQWLKAKDGSVTVVPLTSLTKH